MSSLNSSEQRYISRYHHIEVITKYGFCSIEGSSLYSRDDEIFVLSPGISKGKQGKYWFDIREVVLDRIGVNTKVWGLLRIVPDWFALFPIADIYKLINQETQACSEKSGVLWRFHCYLNETERTIKIESRKNGNYSFNTSLWNCDTIDMGIEDIIQNNDFEKYHRGNLHQ